MGKFIARVSIAVITFSLGVTYGLSTVVQSGYQAPSSMAAASSNTASSW